MNINKLSVDLCVKVFTFLQPSDVQRFILCNKNTFITFYSNNSILWKEVCQQNHILTKQLLRQMKWSSDELSVEDVNNPAWYYQTAKCLEGLDKLTQIRLTKLDESSANIPRMEGHAGTTVLDRYVIIVG
jgi:hypothetical protein